MKAFPNGGLIGKTIGCLRFFSALKISVHGASASFFMVLALFPALLVLLGLLQYTTLEVERLTELLQGMLPQAFLEGAEEIILLTYDKLSGAALGISALTTLWSASRGVYGLIGGLNAAYGLEETRGFFRRRLLSVAGTLGIAGALLLTLGLHILRGLGSGSLLLLQAGLFAALYAYLPDRRGKYLRGLPGAALASLGWRSFSWLYSLYVERGTRLTGIYGPVYAVALGLLWLYCCVCILLWGAVLNRLLEQWEERN